MLTKKNDVTLKRLKGKNRIELLFRGGQRLHSTHLIIHYLPLEQEMAFRFGVSVAKQRFKKAVDRNRIKRQLRMAIESNKQLLPFAGFGMLIFKSHQLIETKVLVLECEALFKQLHKIC